jgi:hypothetical protein
MDHVGSAFHEPRVAVAYVESTSMQRIQEMCVIRAFEWSFKAETTRFETAEYSREIWRAIVSSHSLSPIYENPPEQDESNSAEHQEEPIIKGNVHRHITHVMNVKKMMVNNTFNQIE